MLRVAAGSVRCPDRLGCERNDVADASAASRAYVVS
jgi:hypothetical protein